MADYKICLIHFLWSAEYGDQIAGFLFEPIQGEAGVCLISNSEVSLAGVTLEANQVYTIIFFIFKVLDILVYLLK